MKEFFRELFEYNHHTNQRLSKIFIANEKQLSEKSIKLFSHILNAHHVWNARIKNVQPIYSTWQLHEVKTFHEMDKRNNENSFLILDEFDLNTQINYVLGNGTPHQNLVKDLLFQIINHSTYHRAQIAAEFKNSEIEPLVSDYVAYKW